MIETLLWLILIELTIGFVLSGYVLREMQTALAVIALHDCAETPTVTVLATPSLKDEPVVIDTRETVGTFAGPAAWN